MGRPLRFCMVSTFFGAESFGGDDIYVARLIQVLLRRGHEVHCPAAVELVGRGQFPRAYTPPPGLRVHAVRSPLELWPLLWTHQTGRLGPNAGPLRHILDAGDYDVVRFHNICLIGGLCYTSEEELLRAMHLLVDDDALRGRLGARGRDTVQTRWAEQTHVDTCLALVKRLDTSGRRN